MKKRMFSLILCLLLMASLVLPVSAAYEYGKYYDETEELCTQGLEEMGTSTLVQLSDALRFDIRMDVFTSLNDDGIVSTAEYVFENYYGDAVTGEGVSLTIYVMEDGDGWYVEQWYIHVEDQSGAWADLDDYLYDYIDDGFAEAAWNGDLRQDAQAVEQISGLLAAGVTLYATENGISSERAVLNGAQSDIWYEDDADEEEQAYETDGSSFVVAETVDFIGEGNVIDLVGLITQQQDATLEAMISDIANPYQCGCYIVLTPDLYVYGDSAPNAVVNLYHGNNLGLNDTRDGILLMMDPVNREFAFFVYGENAEYIFNDYGQDLLEDVFLDDFAEDAWYDGLEDFVYECGEYMELAAQGEPVSASKTGGYAMAILVGLIVAAIVCFVLISQMKSVAVGAEASEYVVDGTVSFTEKQDSFLYKTTTTRDLSDDNDGNTSSFSGGGGSGRSGSF